MFVGNLSFDVSREELIEAFSAAGKVVDAKVPTDRETGRPRGFAFVEFENDEAAEKSITLLNGKSLKGRPLRVNEAEDRPRTPGGGGFRPFRPGGPGPGAGSEPGGPPRGRWQAPPPVFPDFPPAENRGRRRAFGKKKESEGKKPERTERRAGRRRDVIDDDDYDY